MKQKYNDLLDFYKRLFDLIDCFHFNSEHTRHCYERYIQPKRGIVIPITHSGISDNRRYKEYYSTILRVGFIGNASYHKGLSFLIEALRELGSYDRWSLNVWGNISGQDKELPIHYLGKYASNTIDEVFEKMDLLVVPSMCNETFSLVTLEALSYGVPVMVSDKVGAKDIIREYDSQFIFSSKKELVEKLKELIIDKKPLAAFNKKILCQPWHHDIKSHAKDIIDKVYLVDHEKIL